MPADEELRETADDFEEEGSGAAVVVFVVLLLLIVAVLGTGICALAHYFAMAGLFGRGTRDCVRGSGAWGDRGDDSKQDDGRPGDPRNDQAALGQARDGQRGGARRSPEAKEAAEIEWRRGQWGGRGYRDAPRGRAGSRTLPQKCDANGRSVGLHIWPNNRDLELSTSAEMC